MLVPVVAMGHMAMTVMHVVGVVTVRDRDVSAVRPMLVGMPVVRHMLAGLTFVGMPLVAAVQVTVMNVVDMVLVRDGHVSTARPVVMRVVGVSAVHGHGSHS